jgi:3-oxoacyl-[acyl-carrier-protein] synthase II
MNIYIRSAACISAQNTLNNDNFLTDVVEYNTTRLSVIEPDYKEFIDPKQIRRMSHVIKMGVAAAKQCLQNGATEMPGAIITGTAFGCMEDTVTFLTRSIEQDEELLPPTAFIQSTHNTVAAQIALMLKCHAYNNTFVHKGVSFESALFDAIMLLKEQDADNILVGGTEEMIDVSFTVFSRLGLYKRHPVSNLSLFAANSKGTIGGEGAAFFLLTDKESTANMAELMDVNTFYNPKDNQDIEKRIAAFLKARSLTTADIDLVITGKNGDVTNDKVYNALNNSIFNGIRKANYKHLCGEYTVASSFALWLAANIIKKGVVPEVTLEERLNIPAPKKVLIYNHYQNKYHSLMLVSAI